MLLCEAEECLFGFLSYALVNRIAGDAEGESSRDALCGVPEWSQDGLGAVIEELAERLVELEEEHEESLHLVDVGWREEGRDFLRVGGLFVRVVLVA